MVAAGSNKVRSTLNQPTNKTKQILWWNHLTIIGRTRVKSCTPNHRVVVHVCAEACWHTELILCAHSILVPVAESSWDLFSPLSSSVSVLLFTLSKWIRPFSVHKHRAQPWWLKTPDTLETNINQVTTWKTMSTWGLSPTKIACNPIICLGESHVLTEWRPNLSFIFVRICFPVDLQSYQNKRWREATTASISHVFVFISVGKNCSWSNHSHAIITTWHQYP